MAARISSSRLHTSSKLAGRHAASFRVQQRTRSIRGCGRCRASSGARFSGSFRMV